MSPISKLKIAKKLNGGAYGIGNYRKDMQNYGYLH